MSGFLTRRTDLPLARDPSVRLLPWMIALMVYLATLMLAGLLVLSSFTAAWNEGLQGALTIQVVPHEGEGEEALAARVEAAARVALKTPGVASAEPIPLARVAAMLAPWIGDPALVEELPIPRLIDVRLQPGAPVDTAALRARLVAEVPDTDLDDHAYWRERVVTFTRSIEGLAGIMVFLLGLAAASIVVFATRSGLAVHRGAIEVLHLIGARDLYIAGEFESHATRLALIGGGLGMAVGAATLLGFAWLASRLSIAALPPFLLEGWQWPVLLAVPLAAAVVARLTARWTVVRALATMV